MKERTFETVKKLFIVRACLWAVSLAATIYWVVWSFKLYADNGGAMDPYLYASILRPKMYAGLAIAAVCLLISVKLRGISDKIKDEIKHRV
ncbi:MAG: hypothetical protein MJ107_00140 [Lachnospiraceae bacterium]|nr:hypothetical protein [Lachnospiraceae bacterium]